MGDGLSGAPAALLLAVLGGVAGFVNTLAGGGSLLTLPALMLIGLPADLANATNRVSVFAQSAAGALGFDKSGKLDRPAVPWLAAPSVAGAFLGSWAASVTPPAILKPVLIGTLLAVAVLMVASPKTMAPPEGARALRVRDRPVTALWMFLIGIYGGFVQAGVGILLLAALAGVLRYDLARANALKIVIVAIFTVAALIVFIAKGQVVWLPALALSVGTVAGARLGVAFAITQGHEALRRAVFAITVLACVAALFK